MTQTETGTSLVRYRAPDEGIEGPEDYPNAPISIVMDRSTPGADLFGVSVAIGGDIPLHLHSMMEFQFVLGGTGLALDAYGGETPIAPGGTVLSPAGASGAHGFTNTGSLPLTLLCVYPSPGGATPDRAPFDAARRPGDGPASVYVPPDAVVPTSATDDDIRAACIIDGRIDGAELYAELLAIGAKLPLHHHPAAELLYVLSGTGVVVDIDGHATGLAPGGVLSCPAGPGGAHAIRNGGAMPIQVLSVFPADGGERPDRTLI